MIMAYKRMRQRRILRFSEMQANVAYETKIRFGDTTV